MILGIFFIVLTASRGIHTIPHQLKPADFPHLTFLSHLYRSPSKQAHAAEIFNEQDDYAEGITSKSSVPDSNNYEKYEAKRSINDSLTDNYVSFYSGNSSADNTDSDTNVYEYPEIYVNGKTNVTNERIRLETDNSINVTTVSQGFVAKRNSTNGEAPGVSGQMSNSSDEVDKLVQSNLSGKTEKTADALNETEKTTELVLEKANGQSESSDSTTNSHIHSVMALSAKGNQFLDKSAADFKKVLTTCPHCDVAEYFSKQARNYSNELAHSLNERSINNKTITSVEKDDMRTEMASNSSLNSTSEPTQTPPASTNLGQNPTQKSEESTGTLKNVSNSEIKNHTDNKSAITNKGKGEESKLDEKVHPTKMPMLEGEKNEKHDHAKVNTTTSTVGQHPIKELQITSGHTKIENPPDKKGRTGIKEKAPLGNLFRLHDMDEEEDDLLGKNGNKADDVQMSNSTSKVVAKELQATPAASEDDETAEERDSSIKNAMNWQGNERMDSINGLRRGSLKSQMSLDDMDMRNLGDNSIVEDDHEDVAAIGEDDDSPSSGMMNQVSFASLFIALLSFHWFLQCSGTVLSALSSDFARSAMDLDPDLHYFDNPQ